MGFPHNTVRYLVNWHDGCNTSPTICRMPVHPDASAISRFHPSTAGSWDLARSGISEHRPPMDSEEQ